MGKSSSSIQSINGYVSTLNANVISEGGPWGPVLPSPKYLQYFINHLCLDYNMRFFGYRIIQSRSTANGHYYYYYFVWHLYLQKKKIIINLLLNTFFKFTKHFRPSLKIKSSYGFAEHKLIKCTFPYNDFVVNSANRTRRLMKDDWNVRLAVAYITSQLVRTGTFTIK